MVEAGAALVLGEEGKVGGRAHLAALGCHGGLGGRQEAKLPGKRVLAPARWGPQSKRRGMYPSAQRCVRRCAARTWGLRRQVQRASLQVSGKVRDGAERVPGQRER